MSPILELIVAAVVGYLCGSIPFAVIVAKAYGLEDPRKYGSGNPGATNVMRSGNKLAGRLVFAADCLKGILPALLLGFVFDSQDALAVCAGLAVVGHVWSPWLNFAGGRGVATGFGALLVIDWRSFLIAVAIWITIYSMVKIVSLGSACGFLAAAVASFMIFEQDGLTGVAVAGIAMIVVIRHRSNFKDLLAGKERSFAKPDENEGSSQSPKNDDDSQENR